jgi:hypothetical protein
LWVQVVDIPESVLLKGAIGEKDGTVDELKTAPGHDWSGPLILFSALSIRTCRRCGQPQISAQWVCPGNTDPENQPKLWAGTLWIEVVDIPEGVRLKSVIGEKDGVLYDLKFVGPTFAEDWILPVED